MKAFQKRKSVTQLAVCTILNLWISFYMPTTNPLDSPFFQSITNFVSKRVIMQYPHVGRQMHHNLTRAKSFASSELPVNPVLPLLKCSRFNLQSFEPHLIAKTMCLLDLENFQSLRVSYCNYILSQY